MAVVLEDDDENKEIDPLTGLPVSQEAPSDSVGGIPTGGATGSQTPSSAPSQPSNRVAGSGRFQNLRSYIQANQGAGTQLGGKIGQDIQREGAGIGGQIAEERQRIEGARQQEADRLNATDPFIQSAVNQASQTVQDPEQLARFARIREGVIDRPDFKEAPIEEGVGKLRNIQSRTGNEQGRFDLLRNTFGMPGYSRGATRLDQLLLQADPTALRDLNITGQTTAEEQQAGLDEAIGRETAIGEELGTLGQLKADLAMSTAGEGETELTSALDKRAQDELARLTEGRESIARKLSRGESLTDEEYETLGVPDYQRGRLGEMINLRTKEDLLDKIVVKRPDGSQYDISGALLAKPEYSKLGLGAQIPGGGGIVQEKHLRKAPKFDFSQYMGKLDPASFSAESVASVEEAGRMNALQQLMGEAPSFNTAKAASAPGEIGFDISTAMDRALSEIAPGQTYNPQSGEIEPEEGDPNAWVGTAVIGIATQVYPPVGYTLLAVDMATGGMVSNTINKIAAPAISVLKHVPIVGSIFCFVTGTPIDMADGTTKPVEELDSTDEVLLGGMVQGGGWSYTDAVVDYNGVTVTPTHLFFVDGKWYRADELAPVRELDSPVKVHPIVTENHLLVAKGTISADVVEHDDFMDLNADGVMEALNSDDKRNEWLSEQSSKLDVA